MLKWFLLCSLAATLMVGTATRATPRASSPSRAGAPLDTFAGCVLLSRINDLGITVADCATVNCNAASACDEEVKVIEQHVWLCCRCEGFGLPPSACDGFYNATAAQVFCDVAQCTTSCVVHSPSGAWSPACDCTFPPI